MDKNEKKDSMFAGFGIIAGFAIGAFLGWIAGLVLWVVFSIFSPIGFNPPLFYHIAWAIVGVIGIIFMK